MDFCHLHLHTEFSLLDGFAKISELPSRLKDLGMSACAITDHGVMFGVVEFYKKLTANGIKPIIGCEVYVTEGELSEKNPEKRKLYHLILIAENDIGYRNLISLVSLGYTDGFYYKPRINRKAIKEKSEGLIALSGCIAGEVSRRFLDGDEKGARDAAKFYLETFGGSYFLELQDHGIKDERRVNKFLVSLGEELGIELVATNDVHYISKEDAKIHDVLLCIQTQSTVNESNRMKFQSSEFYLKSPEEMAEIFRYAPKAVSNTIKIAQRCNVKFEFGKYHLPKYELSPGINFGKKEYLRKLTYEGLLKRYGSVSKELEERADYELEIIEKMGFTDYFLIVRDFIHYAKINGIPVGPGRGSAAGSLISYAISITEIDPIKFNLLFERFLNPERISMPDIDVDFCFERREEVIQYVIKKYGEENVAQIATFGTMLAKGAIRDVARALAVPLYKADRLAKLVPAVLNITLEQALSQVPELKKLYDNDDETKKIVDTARAVEGMPRHVSTHAAGVVITKEPVTHYVPLVKTKDSIATEYNMTELEELGLLKMDFLGLRTLTVIHDAIKMSGENIDLEKIDDCDSKIFELFQKGETLGVFQFESEGMRAFLRELKPTTLEDLVAANSLYRPGPMSQIPKFIEGKHNPDSVSYIDPKLEPILNKTYGCIVWQEQVIEIFRDLAGFSMGRADLVRRAMSKKKMSVMEAERKVFIYGEGDIKGAVKNGVKESAADAIYDLMIDFANYAFNKSHSAAYSIVAYQTAYLKAYYPNEYMAALLTSMMGNIKQTAKYIAECKKMGLVVDNPDVQTSYGSFTVVDGKISFGLYAIKNVGTGFVEAIVKARNEGKFSDLENFLRRINKIDKTALNKRAVESLIFAGAFDKFGLTRAQLANSYEDLVESVHMDSRKNLPGQIGFFEDSSQFSVHREIPEYPMQYKLEKEKEMLGLYISGHPLDDYRARITVLSEYTAIQLLELLEDLSHTGLKDGELISIAGMISEKKMVITKKNETMAFLKIEDFTGEVEAIAFPKFYEKYSASLELNTPLLFKGRLMIESDSLKIAPAFVAPLEDYSSSSIVLKFSSKDDPLIEKVGEIVKRNIGETNVFLNYKDTHLTQKAKAKIKVDENSLSELLALLGKDFIELK